MTPRITPELFTLPLEQDSYLVYAPLERSAFIGDPSAVRLLADLESGRRQPADDDELCVLLTQLGILDPRQPQLPTTPPLEEFRPTEVTLLLTTACNLRCGYCFASSGDRPAKFMTMETARGGIDFVLASAIHLKAPAICLSFHGGGEPTRNWPVLTGAVDYARTRGKDAGVRINSGMATNGVLSDPEIDWLAANINSASISFDGLPEIQDTNRKQPSGAPTSERVLHTMRRWDQAGFGYSVRATILASQIPLLPDAVDFVFSNFRANTLQVEPVYRLGRGREEESAETVEFIEAFRAAFQRARKYGRELRLSGARVGPPMNHFCAATLGSFCLSTDGYVTACYEVFDRGEPWADIFFYGKPGPTPGTFEFDKDLLRRLRAQGVENRAYCRECFARWTCAGECYHKVLEQTNGSEWQGSARCQLIREITKEFLLDRIARSGGLAWREDWLGPNPGCCGPAPGGAAGALGIGAQAEAGRN